MKLKIMMCTLLAAAVSAANACTLQIRVACPGDRTAAGIEVCIEGVGCAKTDSLGIVSIEVPYFGTYTVCVNEATLPPGATLGGNCKKVLTDTEAPAVVEFSLGGDFCKTPPPPGGCWMTCGGQVGRIGQGVANYTFGGVVYPGCSPKAAEGGNFNIVDHGNGTHFKGEQIVVDSCSGVNTKSPKVNVNIIDFHGTGTIAGLNGDPSNKVPVTFVGRAVDNLESGSNADLLYIQVIYNGNVVLQIGASAVNPATISNGNIQIHQSSCN